MKESNGNGVVDAGEVKVTTADMEGRTLKKAPMLFSSRFGLAFIAFFGFLNLYALRVNISVAMVCMVNHTAVKALSSDGDASTVANVTGVNGTAYNVTGLYNVTTKDPSEVPAQCARQMDDDDVLGGSLVFNKQMQGLILGSFFWGYIFTIFPGGWLATKYGGKRVYGGCMLGAAMATLLTPIAAQTHYIFLIAMRVVCGLGSGVAYPAMHAIWSHWAPPLERSKLLAFTFAGAWLGNVITMPIAGLLCKYGFAGGWPSIFYVFGGAAVIWCVLWFALVYDYPSEHPRISAKELEYIQDSLRGAIDDETSSDRQRSRKVNPPWKSIFTSAPVWGIIVVNTCSDWGLYTFLTNLPTYLNEVLHFDIASNGLFSALPFLGFWLMTMISGVVADSLRDRRILSTTVVRKMCQGIGFVIPAILIIPAGFMSCTQTTGVVALLTLCVTFTGWQFGGGFLINPGDLSPKYSGLIFGISNTIATVAGFVVPIVIGAITKDGTKEQWRVVFFSAAAIYLVGTVAYMFLGSGEVQPWATEGDDEEGMEAKKPMNVELDDVLVKNGQAENGKAV